GDSYEVDGYVGGPLGEQVAGALSFQYSDRDYYLENTGSTPQGPGQIEELFLQGRLQWTPTDRLTIDALAYVIDTQAPGIYTFDGFPVDLDRYNAIYSDGALFDPTDPFTLAPFNGSDRASDFRFVHDAPKRAEVTQIIAGANATYATNAGVVDFALSYRTEDTDDRGFDIDGTNAPLLAGAEEEEEEVFNAEIRFTSDPVQSLRYSLGASYYFEEDVRALGSLIGPGSLNDFVFSPDQSVASYDVGLFGSLSYTPSSWPNLTATFGLRYDRARRETTQEAGALDLGFAVFFFNDLELEETFDAFLPRFALKYEPSDTVTLYGSAAKGYLPGGFNLTAADAGFEGDVTRYDSEELWSYELGARWKSASGRARLAGAVFYIDAENYQEITALLDEQGNVISTSLVASDAAIENYGFELEGHWNISDLLTLTGNLGVTEAEYKEFSRLEASEVVGNPVKLIPEYDANIALRYQNPSGFFVRGEVNFIGETPLDEGNRTGFTANALDTQEAVEMYGMQAGYETELWSLRVFGENLSDVRRVNGTGFPNAVLPFDGLLNASIDTPRTVGVEVTVRWN
ncbi:MAG: TonB-dependent receptor, partial [Pseudomonadota bacterium]